VIPIVSFISSYSLSDGTVGLGYSAAFGGIVENSIREKGNGRGGREKKGKEVLTHRLHRYY